MGLTSYQAALPRKQVLILFSIRGLSSPFAKRGFFDSGFSAGSLEGRFDRGRPYLRKAGFDMDVVVGRQAFLAIKHRRAKVDGDDRFPAILGKRGLDRTREVFPIEGVSVKEADEGVAGFTVGKGIAALPIREEARSVIVGKVPDGRGGIEERSFQCASLRPVAVRLFVDVEASAARD